jgi:hypothetical protein
MPAMGISVRHLGKAEYGQPASCESEARGLQKRAPLDVLRPAPDPRHLLVERHPVGDGSPTAGVKDRPGTQAIRRDPVSEFRRATAFLLTSIRITCRFGAGPRPRPALTSISTQIPSRCWSRLGGRPPDALRTMTARQVVRFAITTVVISPPDGAVDSHRAPTSSQQN